MYNSLLLQLVCSRAIITRVWINETRLDLTPMSWSSKHHSILLISRDFSCYPVLLALYFKKCTCVWLVIIKFSAKFKHLRGDLFCRWASYKVFHVFGLLYSSIWQKILLIYFHNKMAYFNYCQKIPENSLFLKKLNNGHRKKISYGGGARCVSHILLKGFTDQISWWSTFQIFAD